LDGTVIIDTLNHIFFHGDVAISGNTTVGGILGASTIAPLSGNNLTIDLGRPVPDLTASSSASPSATFGDLVIKGIGDKVVAKITASGSAMFSGSMTIEGATTINGPLRLSADSVGTSVSIAKGERFLTLTGLTLPDTNYSLFATPSWNTSTWIDSKATSSATIRFSGPAPAGASVDWLLLLQGQKTSTSSGTLLP
jgi:hypothetical protein